MLTRTPTHTVWKSKRSATGARFASILLAAAATASAAATDFKFHKPTAGGTIEIGFKSLTEKCEFIKVKIDATDTAEKKAEKIAKELNNKCGTIFTAKANGSTVSVTNDIHINQRVFIHVKSDDTGEKDQIKKDVTPAFWEIFSTSGWYEPDGASTGLSRAGDGTQGYLTIGNSRYVANVPTLPGVPLIQLLSQAVEELHANGVPEAELVDLGEGRGAIRLPWTDADDFIEFGADDLGIVNRFDERGEPLRLDLQAVSLTLAAEAPGIVVVTASVAAVVGGEDYAPGVAFSWQVQVNGVTQAAGFEFVPVVAGLSCYAQSPPDCDGSCPPGSLGCVHVEWPFDWCGCYFDFKLPDFTLVANPGDTVALVVDPDAGWFEDNEENNALTAVVPKTGQPCPGDINGDGLVGQSDLGALLSAFATCAGDPQYLPNVDLDGDGCVGQPDLGILLSHWGPCPPG